jgi:hypothetical protein
LVGAAFGHIDEMRHEFASEFGSVDEVRHAEALTPCLLLRIHIDPDDHCGADEAKALDDEIGAKLGKHTKVADIHGGDIADMHRRITESGRPVRANRILAICSKMFVLALMPKAGETLPWRNAAQAIRARESNATKRPRNGSSAKPN